MQLSEDKQSTNGENKLSIQHFEKMLMDLLKSHEAYRKKIRQLLEENNVLKGLLHKEKNNLKLSTAVDKNLKYTLHSDNKKVSMAQINSYIKEIDLCLVYFEQI